jgi:hypothetical protein
MPTDLPVRAHRAMSAEFDHSRSSSAISSTLVGISCPGRAPAPHPACRAI